MRICAQIIEKRGLFLWIGGVTDLSTLNIEHLQS